MAPRAWTVLEFGRHKGKTLPQVLFSDPDWFFWALTDRALDRQPGLGEDAAFLEIRARNIRVPHDGNEKVIVEYVALSGRLASVEVVPESQPAHQGAHRTEGIDLSMPRFFSGERMDKTGARVVLHAVRFYVFGNQNTRMTRNRCHAFFEDDANFLRVKP